jgi:hypothetical protein
MKALFSLTILAALVRPIYAVDGVVLINQSAALAGNVTPGDAPGFPVTISVSGSYKLSSNLTVPNANTDAIDITADKVTIDLNGFSIIGPVACSDAPPTSCSPAGTGIGINSRRTNVFVLNGGVYGMGAFGIELFSSSRIQSVQLSNNGGGGIAMADGGEISSCVVNSNGGNGITIGSGIVSGNSASFNGGDGIIVVVGLISGNTTFGNGGNGGNASAVAGSTFTGNVSFRNGSAGITVACPSLVTSNSVSQNSANIVTSGSGCTVVTNSAP